MKFKIGDRVLVTDNDGNWASIGDIGPEHLIPIPKNATETQIKALRSLCE